MHDLGPLLVYFVHQVELRLLIYGREIDMRPQGDIQKRE